MSKPYWIFLAVALAGPVVLAVVYGREFLAVDAALDSGASYDYLEGRADFSQNHPYIPFSDRHGALIAVAGCSMLVLAGCLVCFMAAFVRRMMSKDT